jgi:hypothetical protein
MDWIKAHLLALAIGAIPVGVLAMIVVQGAKKLHDTIDALPAYIKVGAAFLCSALLTAVAAYFHIPLTCPEGTDCLAQVDSKVAGLFIQAILGGLVALLTHSGKVALLGNAPEPND